MKYITFGPDVSKVQTAILIKENALNKDNLLVNYIRPSSLPEESFIALGLRYDNEKSCKAATAKNHLYDVMCEVVTLGIKNILVCDPIYFKTLTKQSKADVAYNTIYKSNFEEFSDQDVILAPNYRAILYNPNTQQKLDLSVQTLSQHATGVYQDQSKNIIQKAYYPKTTRNIKKALKYLLTQPEITVDIEARSLKFWKAGLSTISFAWNQHEGIAFPIDRIKESRQIRRLLRAFLTKYTGKNIYHNAGYDMKVLVYELWMNNLADYRGMLKGINVLTRNFDDTKLITYLATNNAVENVLGLKKLSIEFAGDYAEEDIKNTNKIPLPELLEYNLKDCLCTWYVYNKYYSVMVADQQESLYQTLFKPTVKSLLQMELCGMPINPVKVQKAKKELTAVVDSHTTFLENNHHIQKVHIQLLEAKAQKYTAKAKQKVYTIHDSVIQKDLEKFNPNSHDQIRYLLYDYFGLPVIDLTDTKQPATGGKTLQKMVNHTQDVEIIEIINHLCGVADASKILTTFIPAFEKAQQLPDGSYRLYGNFNLGGTQSLRLSSSDPNLQNLPSNSKYAPCIKECFEPISGWLYAGSDFDSLEDKANALVTRDPNKLKVYTDGYDGHCLRTYSYFTEQMIGIDPNSVASINSIKSLYPELRQDSKAPTFALTYDGTFRTLMNNCGFSEKKAKLIESKYHELYQIADRWIADKILTARKIGYIPLAFGGRIRTPLLAKAGSGRLPYMATKEARSAGNAATQSYCSLTLRALNEFMERVWASPYKYCILPVATIHDAIYLMLPDSAKILQWVNKNLIECMSWQGLPELQHPTIKITSGLEVYWPHWNNKIKIPNNASIVDLKTICKKGVEKYEQQLKAA